MKIKRTDIEPVQFLHDRLIDVHSENYNVDYLLNARRTIAKLHGLVNGDITSQEKALHKHGVIKRKWWNHFFIGFAVGMIVVLLGISAFTFMFL